MSVGGAVSFFMGNCCSVEGDVHFFFTAFGTMRTLDSVEVLSTCHR